MRERPAWAERLQAEREQRSWNKPAMARALWAAAGEEYPPLRSLTRQIRGWEMGDHVPDGRWRAAYAAAFNISEAALFSGAQVGRRQCLKGAVAAAIATPPAVMPMLVSSGDTNQPRRHLSFTVDSAEALLARLYRFEAAFGGNELCAVIGDQVNAATSMLSNGALNLTTERRLYLAVAGLTQIAGWLAIDANRHGDASRYLTATMYAAHEVGDLGLAAHAMGYLSLHALYRDQPRRALALAETAGNLAHAEGAPRTRATLHNRAARAHARLGDGDACRRHLDAAQAAFSDGESAEGDPQWIDYVNAVEIAAQRGACYLDLGLPDEAITALTEAINLIQPEQQRDLTHYKIRLSCAYLLGDEPAHAAAIAHEAHTAAALIGSARVDERFRELVMQLREHDVREVRELMDAIRPS